MCQETGFKYFRNTAVIESGSGLLVFKMAVAWVRLVKTEVRIKDVSFIFIFIYFLTV
jgi:hypothetical protein